jgi:hypothetical protein
VSSSVIFIDQCGPDGGAIHYNVDIATKTAAAAVEMCLNEGRLVEVPNERGGDPLFVNPEFVTSIIPGRASKEG